MRAAAIGSRFDGRLPVLVTDDRQLAPASIRALCVGNTPAFELDAEQLDPGGATRHSISCSALRPSGSMGPATARLGCLRERRQPPRARARDRECSCTVRPRPRGHRRCHPRAARRVSKTIATRPGGRCRQRAARARRGRRAGGADRSLAAGRRQRPGARPQRRRQLAGDPRSVPGGLATVHNRGHDAEDRPGGGRAGLDDGHRMAPEGRDRCDGWGSCRCGSGRWAVRCSKTRL